MSTVHEVSTAIMAPPSPTSSAPRRIACDRCHGQKLKCPRDINGTGPCTRCAKAGAICQVSPARATGRPAKNPKPQHRKSESSTSINSSRPSLTESNSSTDEDNTTSAHEATSSLSHTTLPIHDEYFPANNLNLLPMGNDDAKFFPGADMPFDFVDVADPNYINPMGFEYDDGSGFMNFGSSLPMMMMPTTFAQESPVLMGHPYLAPSFGPLPPPPTPSISLQGEGYDGLSNHEDSKLDERSSRSNSLAHDYSPFDLSSDSLHRPAIPRSSSCYSPSLKRSYTMSENSLPATALPIRARIEDESMTKKRRVSSMPVCTPDPEQTWSSNLGFSQALSSIQFEVDNFSKALMSQTLQPSLTNVGNPDLPVDVGVLLPISDKFMALVPQICQQATTPLHSVPKARKSSLKHFLKPQLERSQTEPDSTTLEIAVAECRSIESGLVQLIFTCNARLHFAFSIALDVISHNLSNPVSPTRSPNHPSTSIGSYILPTTSPLSTLLHLHAISHSLERLDVILHKNLGTDTIPSTSFFGSIFCKQKKDEINLHAFKERAFEESEERKSQLMSRIRSIVAEVAGNEP